MTNYQQTRLFAPGIIAYYEPDLVARALENAALLRVSRLDNIKVPHIAEELEDPGKSERRDLDSRSRPLGYKVEISKPGPK